MTTIPRKAKVHYVPSSNDWISKITEAKLDDLRPGDVIVDVEEIDSFDSDEVDVRVYDGKRYQKCLKRDDLWCIPTYFAREIFDIYPFNHWFETPFDLLIPIDILSNYDELMYNLKVTKDKTKSKIGEVDVIFKDTERPGREKVSDFILENPIIYVDTVSTDGLVFEM